MPRPNSLYIHNAKWDNPKKVQSRQETIIQSCQQYIGPSLPENKQYWTLAGAYSSDDHEMESSHLEMNQLIKAGIITEDQYHGVDISGEIIEKNRELYPNAHWHHGDFLETMKEFASTGEFNPGFINNDMVMQKYFGVKYLRNLMKFIDNNIHQSLVLTANFCLNNPYRKSYDIDEGQEIFEALKKWYCFPSHWLVKPRYYLYNGSGTRSNTWLGTFVFVKEEHWQKEYLEEIRFIGE